MSREVLMKETALVCLALVALLGSACPPEAGPRITVSEDSLEISVTEVEGGILVENLSGVACIVVVTSPEGEQEFEMAAGESVTVTGITRPIEVWAVRE